MFFIYKALAHPENFGYISPYTQVERLMHVREAERTLGTTIPWLADGIDNALKHSMGDAPNSEFLVGSDGKVLIVRLWSRPDELRRDVEKLLGAVDSPTRVSDLNLKTEPPPAVAARGVVPRIELPGNLVALKLEPVLESGAQVKPFYVKLRAEVERGALGGKGRLYLGFNLDPLYHVHWNNLVAPLTYEITDLHQVQVSPASGQAVQPKEAADIDPREFLIDLESTGRDARFTVKVTYFACNDEAGWCVRIQQSYVVHLAEDRDGGRARRGAVGRRPARVPGPGAQAGLPGGRLSAIDLEKRLITLELREGRAQTYLVASDARMNRDGHSATLEAFEVEDRVRVHLSEPGEAVGPPVVNGMMGRSR